MSANPSDSAGIGCFLTLPEETPTWACPFAAQDAVESADAALDLSLAVTEVTKTRHRCYVVALTLRMPPDHFHLRIAGVVPARNKMLDVLLPMEPSGYEVIQLPQPLRRASARLSDGTLVHPLLVDGGKVYLTRSGILLVGDTVSDRYAVYRHLVDLGLAGPTAPDLLWTDHIRSSTTDRGILPFRALTFFARVVHKSP